MLVFPAPTMTKRWWPGARGSALGATHSTPSATGYGGGRSTEPPSGNTSHRQRVAVRRRRFCAGEITYPAVTQVLSHREIRHAPGRQEFLVHDAVEVRQTSPPVANSCRPWLPPGRWSRFRACASSRRSTPTADPDARTDRRASSARRAGAPGRRSPGGRRLRNHGVSEGHPHGARADDQVVRFDHSIGTIANTRPLSAGRYHTFPADRQDADQGRRRCQGEGREARLTCVNR